MRQHLRFNLVRTSYADLDHVVIFMIIILKKCLLLNAQSMFQLERIRGCFAMVYLTLPHFSYGRRKLAKIIMRTYQVWVAGTWPGKWHVLASPSLALEHRQSIKITFRFSVINISLTKLLINLMLNMVYGQIKGVVNTSGLQFRIA